MIPENEFRAKRINECQISESLPRNKPYRTRGFSCGFVQFERVRPRNRRYRPVCWFPDPKWTLPTWHVPQVLTSLRIVASPCSEGPGIFRIGSEGQSAPRTTCKNTWKRYLEKRSMLVYMHRLRCVTIGKKWIRGRAESWDNSWQVVRPTPSFNINICHWSKVPNFLTRELLQTIEGGKG